MRNVVGGLTCKNCGAPVTTEICPFCKCPTGLDSSQADMDYPVLQCKEAHLNFWSVAFPAIFAFGFGFFGFIFPLLFVETDRSITSSLAQSGIRLPHMFSMVYIGCIPFALISIVAFVILIKRLIRYFSIRSKGEKIWATVYGYMDDDVIINGKPAQIVKLLVDTKEKGKCFILYQLGSTTKPYGINSQIELLYYNDMFTIVNPMK